MGPCVSTTIVVGVDRAAVASVSVDVVALRLQCDSSAVVSVVDVSVMPLVPSVVKSCDNTSLENLSLLGQRVLNCYRETMGPNDDVSVVESVCAYDTNDNKGARIT